MVQRDLLTDQLQPHHRGVDPAVLVIPATPTDRFEPTAAVQRDCGVVVHPDLQENLACAAIAGIVEQVGQQQSGDPATTGGGNHAHGDHFGGIAEQQHTGPAEQLFTFNRHHVPAMLSVSQFLPVALLAPRLGSEHFLLVHHQLCDVRRAHRFDSHAQRYCLDVRGAGSTASGRRRYIGVGCSPGAPAITRACAHCRRPLTVG